MILPALLLAVLVFGADDPAPHDPRIDALVTDAAGAPPEFAADALLRIAGSAKVADRAWKRQLIDEAFMRAYGASEPYRRTTQRVPEESRQAAETQAYDTGLNRVTLQVRAAQLMATLAPMRGRELFEWIDLDLAPGTCTDPLVPAVDEYYTAISMMARATFRGARGDALQFLEYYLWRAHLPTEMPAVALAMQRFGPTVDESIHLETLFSALLDRGTSDPRGFSTANFDIVGRIADLQYFDRQRHVPGWFLLDGLRSYLVKHLGGPRCADSTTEALMPATFNHALTLLGVQMEVKPIDGDKITPTRMLSGARIDLLWQTFTAQLMYNGWLALRGRGKDPVPESVRRTDAWREEADLFLSHLEQWNGRSETSERDYLYEKAKLFTNMIDLAPVGPIRSRAIRGLLVFLRQEDTDRSRRALWYLFVRRLIDLGNRDGRAEVLREMEASGNGVIAMYARLERLVPPGARASDR